MIKKIILGFLSVFLCSSSIVYSVSFKFLLEQLYRENLELKAIKKKIKFKEYSVQAAQSGHFPQLSLGGVTSKGKKIKSSTASISIPSSEAPESSQSEVQDSTGDVPQAGTNQSIPGQSINNEGWSSSLSLTFPLFTKFMVVTAVKTSFNNLKYMNIEYQKQKDNKKIQLIRLLMELGTLEEIIPHLQEAEIILQRVKSRSSKRKSKLLYRKSDRLDLESKFYQLKYQKIKAEGALDLGQEALFDLIPNFKDKWLKELPKIKINYEMPEQREVKAIYKANSHVMAQSNLEISSTKEIYQTSNNWDREWIPNVFTSASYGYSGTYDDGDDASDSWRISLGLQFSLFDGFLSSARRGQTFISYQLAKAKRKITINKANLALKHQRLEAKMALAEHLYKKALAEQKKHRILQAKKLSLAGTSTQFEQSVLILDYTKARYESFESLKKYQTALLNIANYLNQLSKVQIYESN